MFPPLEPKLILVASLLLLLGCAPTAASSAEPPGCSQCGVVDSVRAFPVQEAASGYGRGLLAGRESRPVVHRITVRMDDGSVRTLSQPLKPGVAPGDRVRVVQSRVIP